MEIRIFSSKNIFLKINSLFYNHFIIIKYRVKKYYSRIKEIKNILIFNAKYVF